MAGRPRWWAGRPFWRRGWRPGGVFLGDARGRSWMTCSGLRHGAPFFGRWRRSPTDRRRPCTSAFARHVPLLVAHLLACFFFPGAAPPRPLHATFPSAVLLVVTVCRLFRATWSMQQLRWIPKLLSKYIPRGRREDLNRDLAIAQGAVIFFGLMLFGYVLGGMPCGVLAVFFLPVLRAFSPASCACQGPRRPVYPAVGPAILTDALCLIFLYRAHPPYGVPLPT